MTRPESRPGVRQDAGAKKKTPSTDMQADDAGAPISGQPEDAMPQADSGSAAQSVMKQTSKTSAEAGDRRGDGSAPQESEDRSGADEPRERKGQPAREGNKP